MDTAQLESNANAENSIESDDLDSNANAENSIESDDLDSNAHAENSIESDDLDSHGNAENNIEFDQLCHLYKIGINISRDYDRFPFGIVARGNVLPELGLYLSAKQEGWSFVGELRIQFAHDDYSCPTRSKAIMNCSDTSIALITEWIGQCITIHKQCFEVQTVAATRDVLPKRLLDISSAARSGRLRLVTTVNMPQHTLYVTLSHCWGGKCATTLRLDNVATFEDGVEVSILPKTFQDAIVITIKLGVQYLWIDALCIVQDSPDDTEWRHEALIMGDVYANSYLTLAATTSENSNGGLLHKRSPLSVWPCRVGARWTCFEPGRLVVSVDKMTRERDKKPLEDRAWAFQEWLLSKRVSLFA
ncbi:MAG: hypothetical protein Q9223_000791 [Gallowayella weberi]